MDHRTWPEWWTWEIQLSAHVLRRMVVRRFSEVDLREMMEDARDFTPDVEPGRRVIATTWSGTPWEIVVEPDVDTNRLVIVTAYMVE